MKKVHSGSILNLYGRRDIFKRRLREGYNKVAFCPNTLIRNNRLITIWVFYHPNGKIATYEFPVSDNPFEAEYTKEEFKKHKEEFQIWIGQKIGLEKLIEGW